MKFGLFSLFSQRHESIQPRQVYEDVVQLVSLADDIGFDIAWFAEHHFSNYCICPSPLIVASHCAARTKQIRLGSGVLVLPFYSPMRIAEEIAMVDILSGGRCVLGVGSGYQPFEFDRFGLDLNQAQDRFFEILDQIELALSGREFDYHGKFYNQPKTKLAVQPVHDISSEIYVAGLTTSKSARERVAHRGYVPLLQPRWGPATEMQTLRKSYEEDWAQAGRDPATLPFAVLRWMCVTENKREALRAADHLRYIYRVALATRFNYQELDGAIHREIPAKQEPDLEAIVHNALIGSPEKIANQIIDEFNAYRPSHMCFAVNFGDHASAINSLERFAQEIEPLVRKHIGVGDSETHEQKRYDQVAS